MIVFLVRWLEILVFGVFTYQKTGSPFLVAAMTMLRLLPLAIFGVALGVVAARIPRRAGLVVMLSVLTATALVLLFLAASDRLVLWHLAAASFIGGVVWAADNPMRRGLIGDVAGHARMAKAMALDVGASNASRLVGPGSGRVAAGPFRHAGRLRPGCLALYGRAPLGDAPARATGHA